MKKKIIIFILLVCGVVFAGSLRTSILTKAIDYIITNNITYEQLDSITANDLELTAEERYEVSLYPRAYKIYIKAKYRDRQREAYKATILTELIKIRNNTKEALDYNNDEATTLILEVIAEASNEK